MLLTAAVCFTGINDGFAQTYSQDISGYYTRIFIAGTNYFALDLEIGSSNSLNEIFNITSTIPTLYAPYLQITLPEGTIVSFWNPTNRTFNIASTYTNGAWSKNLVLTPGVGVMVTAPQPFTNGFLGTVYNHDGNLFTNAQNEPNFEFVLPNVFSKSPGVYLLGDACPTLDIGTNIFLNILGRMPFIGEKVSTVFTTSTYLGNGQWDVVPTLNVSEAAFFTTLPEPPPALSLQVANNQAIVSWTAYTSVWKLQTNASLNSVFWNDCTDSATNSPVTNSITAGNLFFRLVPVN